MSTESEIKEVKAIVAGAEAITAAATAAAAVEASRSSDTAALLAKVDEKLREHHDDNKKEMRNTLLDVLGDVFGPDESTYVVKNRVPLLCQSVKGMEASILKIQEMLENLDKKFASKLTERIVYAASALILTGFIVAYFLK